MGNKYVYIKPRPSSGYIKPGMVVRRNTVGAVEWAEIMLEGREAFKSLNTAAKKLTSLASSLNVGDKLNKLLDQTQETLYEAKAAAVAIRVQVNRLGDRLDELTSTAEDELRRTSNNANLLLIDTRKRVNEVSASIKRTSDELYAILSENRENVKELAYNAKEASKKLNVILTESRSDIRTSIKNIKEITTTLKKDVDAISPLLQDKRLQANIREIVAMGKDVIETAEFLLAPVKKIREQTLKQKDFRFAMPNVEIAYIENFNHNPVTTLNIDIFPYSSRFFRLGVFDLGFTNLLNLNINW